MTKKKVSYFYDSASHTSSPSLYSAKLEASRHRGICAAHKLLHARIWANGCRRVWGELLWCKPPYEAPSAVYDPPPCAGLRAAQAHGSVCEIQTCPVMSHSCICSALLNTSTYFDLA